MDFSQFRIGFDKRDQEKVQEYWNEIFLSQKWSEGKYIELFEDKWRQWNNLSSVATSSWAGAAMACMNYFDLSGKKVICPTNTFMATPLSIIKAGAEVVFADCNKEDLCLSLDSVRHIIENQDISAIWIVHIGGHISFDIEKISQICTEKNIILIEDCAHAHGASWNNKKPGSWGDAGIYSFYATKTISTGEGGMLVSKHEELIEYAKKYRNYGKFDHDVDGLNFRMSEFTAALGVVQIDRLPEIINWKQKIASEILDLRHENRVKFPPGMKSGYYKYIVFDPIEKSTGKVYADLCHEILNFDVSLPNAKWVSENHWCVPLYYNPGN